MACSDAYQYLRGEGEGRGPGGGPKYYFNVSNTSTVWAVSPEQRGLTGRLLCGEAGPGEMLISPVQVEFWFVGVFFPWVQTNNINKSTVLGSSLGVFVWVWGFFAGSDLEAIRMGGSSVQP